MADCRRIDDLGRVVIPKGVRTILGIEAGDELDVQIAGDMVCYRKHKPADVVEVVRCKDCRWRHDDSNQMWLPCMEMETDPNWFCADGERREVQDG